MRTLSGLLRASHPEPGLAVTVAAALLAIGVGHDPAGVAFVAATVLASQLAVGWTNDWLDADRDTAVGRADKPLATGAVDRRTVGVAGLVAAVATPLLAIASGWPAAACATAALVSALLYNWPLKFTPISVLPYALSFAGLPAFVVLALPGAPTPPAWIVAAGGLLGAGAHFANVLPDLDDDVRTGVRGLPHRIGPAWSRAAAAALLLAATFTLVFGPPGRPTWAGIAAVAAAAVVLPIGWYAGRAATARGNRPVAVFRAVLVVAVIDVILLISSGTVV
ncbi:UbiA family prenyltransferase [Phytohabitans rumicis]|uniref:Membrane protein n=1 Tax=Phytohabitans rumicis TaxID=1076125 RepID=A0A6V8L9Z9_9ACTN|nr:UbiA family prenyltransferase [Phytohabitans rumicis]GFJ90896.1 membrane protein [Phytohabitans rumicis]